jgi:stress-induced-phosphoprotein 1
MSAEELKAKGNAALQGGQVKEAIEFYSQAIGKDSKNKVYFSNRSAAYMKSEDFRSALTDAEQAITLAPSWAKGYSRKGAALYALARFEEAKIAYEEASKLEPGNQTFKDEIARCASNLTGPGGSQPLGGAGGNPLGQDPAEIFRKLSTDPRTKEFMSDPSYMKMLQELSSNPANAMKHMGDPRMQATLQVLFGVNLGSDAEGNESASFEAPKPAEAEKPKFGMDDMDTSGPSDQKKTELIEDPIDDDEEAPAPTGPDNKQLAIQAKEDGNKFYKKKQFNEAIAAYDKAIELDPANCVFYNNKSAVHMEQGEFDKARDLAHKAIEIGRENRAEYTQIAKFYSRIATCYEKEKDLDQALKWYNKSLSEHRDKKTLEKVTKIEKEKKESDRRAYFNREKAEEERAEGNDLFKKGKFPEALKHYNEGIKRTPDDDKETLSKFYSNRAGAYMKLMDFNRAQKDCEECLKLNPSFVRAWIRKGAVLEAMKQHDNAIEAYQEAIKLDPNAKEATEGMNRVYSAKYASRNDPEQVRQRAMNDPEVAQIMGDPSMRMILDQMQSNPSAAAEHMRNPEIARKIQKLVDVGLISVSSR